MGNDDRHPQTCCTKFTAFFSAGSARNYRNRRVLSLHKSYGHHFSGKNAIAIQYRVAQESTETNCRQNVFASSSPPQDSRGISEVSSSGNTARRLAVGKI